MHRVLYKWRTRKVLNTYFGSSNINGQQFWFFLKKYWKKNLWPFKINKRTVSNKSTQARFFFSKKRINEHFRFFDSQYICNVMSYLSQVLLPHVSLSHVGVIPPECFSWAWMSLRNDYHWNWDYNSWIVNVIELLRWIMASYV